MNYNDEKYQNNYLEKVNLSIPNNPRLMNGKFSENNNNQKLNNYPSDMIFSNSMVNPYNNKIEPLINSQSYRPFASYQNNADNQYKFDLQYKSLEAKDNLVDNYYYKYTPKNSNSNNNNNINFNTNDNNLLISNTTNTNCNNNNGQILSQNILASSNKKNISLTTQISQEIDRQKLKFDEMIEKAKNFNNSENFEFDIRKYLPKENSYENSKALRKYKDLAKINNYKCNCYSTRNNFEKNMPKKEMNYDDIKDNTLSEIPKNDYLFEDELSKSEINFNIQSPNKNKDSNNINDKEMKKQNNDEKISQENLKKNLMINLDNENINTDKNKNNDILINNDNSNKNKELNNIINNNSPNNSDICFKNNSKKNDENINQNINNDNNKNLNTTPFYHIYVEKLKFDFNEEENNGEDEEEKLNEIEKANIELNKEEQNAKILYDINELNWHCLDFYNDKQEKIFDEFFKNEI